MGGEFRFRWQELPRDRSVNPADILQTTFQSRGVLFPARLTPQRNRPQSMKSNLPSKLTRRSGFTLLEMVIVLGIIAVLLGGSIALIGGLGEGAKLQRVEADFNAIGAALKTYKLNAGTYPTSQQGLAALVTKPGSTPIPRRWTKLADKVPLDPWEAEYIYKFPGSKNASEYELISKGKDGQQGTDDDFSSQDPK
jgi:general secretion pathway protein G